MPIRIKISGTNLCGVHSREKYGQNLDNCTDIGGFAQVLARCSVKCMIVLIVQVYEDFFYPMQILTIDYNCTKFSFSKREKLFVRIHERIHSMT